MELTKEATKMGFKINVLDKSSNLFYIEGNGQKVLFKSTDFWGNSALWFKIAKDKWLTYKVLEDNNLPIAKSVYLKKWDFQNFTENFIKKLNFPLIVKPLEEWHGNGVLMNIQNLVELQKKLRQSFEEYDSMIIQEQIEWEEVRLLIVKWELTIAINRIPASVTWDGEHDIQALIKVENENNPLRGEGYETALSLIEIDNELQSYLETSGYHLSTIPKKDKVIQLRGNSNIWTGGNMENVTNLVHPSTVEICKKILDLFSLEISGIDLMTTDISRPLSETWGIILEVNGTPWIGGHREVLWVNSAKIILESIFKL